MKLLASLILLVLAAAVVLLPRVPSGIASEPARSILSDTTFAVVNSGSTAYRIDGVLNPTLTVRRGQTVFFNVTAIGHPFYIKTQRTTGIGNQFTDGVTGNGDDNGTVEFLVPSSAPSTLFYQCGVHGAMGGTLNIQSQIGVWPIEIPLSVFLGPAWPNPTRDDARFTYSFRGTTRVFFAVFDGRGRRVRTLVDGVQPEGGYGARWDGRDAQGRLAPSGIYFYRLRAQGGTLSGRLVMAR